MSFTNIKLNGQAQRGFTIVELLIVVVVIAILAAITIVSYNGITSRANQSAAKASASTVAKKAELFAADSGVNRYPVAIADTPAFPGTDQSKTWYYSGVTATYSTTALTSTTGTSTTVRILKCAGANVANQAAVTANNLAGLVIIYWDPVAGAEDRLTVGATATPAAGPALCPTT